MVLVTWVQKIACLVLSMFLFFSLEKGQYLFSEAKKTTNSQKKKKMQTVCFLGDSLTENYMWNIFIFGQRVYFFSSVNCIFHMDSKIARHVPFLLWAIHSNARTKNSSYHLVRRSRTFPFLQKATATTTAAAAATPTVTAAAPITKDSLYGILTHNWITINDLILPFIVLNVHSECTRIVRGHDFTRKRNCADKANRRRNPDQNTLEQYQSKTKESGQ